MMRSMLLQSVNLTRRLALGLAVATTLSAMLPATKTFAAAKNSITIGMGTEAAGLDPTAGANVFNGQVTWQNIFQ